ncbi:outer membrane biosynthesis protein TonB [Flavobacterium sp. CG_9.1]|uniref:energy transducer TonB n=1 Tax=Flavobacterium sp. CG_9.1 TaxID=2787728 RepID=UPI0018C9F160|nr:energy transducer TonB [Flavobacterium sp. CG_9.1]MBG6060568.1 outer membrane biosynthesis protein TonB [Flavobacterium sp. CG_9.1]
MLEVRPEPLKGIKDFYKHIGKNFNVPRVYENMKGKIITTFVIEKDGEIVELKNIKSVFEILDQEAIRVIRSYGKWKPRLQRGQNVKVLYSIPILLSGVK